MAKPQKSGVYCLLWGVEQVDGGGASHFTLTRPGNVSHSPRECVTFTSRAARAIARSAVHRFIEHAQERGHLAFRVLTDQNLRRSNKQRRYQKGNGEQGES